MPVKPLSFKGDKKLSRKRKHHESSLNDSGFPNSTTSSAAIDGDDESWASPSSAADLNGPAIIVLPTIPPTCLASDANGRVFASPLENMVEGDPRTAEPHDVRQVWVATKMPGSSSGSKSTSTSTTSTTNSVEIGFKGAHGGWLSCDSVGVLGATREARGMEELFTLEKASQNEGEDQSGMAGQKRGIWLLRTAASTNKRADGDDGMRYISAVDSGNENKTMTTTTMSTTKSVVSLSLRGDGTREEPSTRLILRMQARFLPNDTSSGGIGGGPRTKSNDKVSRTEMEKAVGRRLEDDEVKRLKRARRQGLYHEEVLDMRSKGKHDKFA